MYIHPDARLNKFKDVRIPSAAELALQFGERDPMGHGDDLSNGLPDNLQGIDNLDRLMIERERAARAAADYEAQRAKANEPKANEPASVQPNDQAVE